MPLYFASARWGNGHGIYNYKAQADAILTNMRHHPVMSYTLDGHELEARRSTGLVSTNAVASLAATAPQARQFVQALWNAPIPSGEQRYYDGMLYMMSLMHCGGEFRIWTPK